MVLTLSKAWAFVVPYAPHNFIVLPTHGDGVNPVPDHLKTSPPEPILWTFEEASGKNIVEGEDPGPGPMAEAIHHCLIQAKTGKSPDDLRALATAKGLATKDGLAAGVKAGQVVDWLKTDFGLGHGHAMAIVAFLKGKTS